MQRDKEDLERALGGLRKRLQDGDGPPLLLETARKQQHTLERELSRVHQLLAENSKVFKVPSRCLVLFLQTLYKDIIIFITINIFINNSFLSILLCYNKKLLQFSI